MKVVLLALLCGLLAAQAVPDVEPVIYQAVSAAQESISESEHLWFALEMPESYSVLNAAEAKMKTGIGESLKEALDEIVKGYKKAVNDTREVVEVLKGKVAEIKEKAREFGSKSKEAVHAVETGVQNIIAKLRELIETKKDNLDQQMDKAAKMSMKDLLTKLKETLAEKIHHVREHVKQVILENEVMRKLKDVLHRMSDSDLTRALNKVLDFSGNKLTHLKKLYNELVEFVGKEDDVLLQKLYHFSAWINNIFSDVKDTTAEKFHDIKSATFNMISETKDHSVKAVHETLELLKEYREDLGDLYEKLVDHLKKVVGEF